MSIVAWNKEVIAWDSQSTLGGTMKLPSLDDKVKVANGKVYALTGSQDIFDWLIKWEQTGANPDDIPVDTPWTFVVFEADKPPAFYNHEIPLASWVWPQHAIGTGTPYALAAMRAGADPIRAAEIAAELDTSCGPPIKSLRFADVLGAPKEKRKSVRVVSMKKKEHNQDDVPSGNGTTGTGGSDPAQGS